MLLRPRQWRSRDDLEQMLRHHCAIVLSAAGVVIWIMLAFMGFTIFEQATASTLIFILAELVEMNATLKGRGRR